MAKRAERTFQSVITSSGQNDSGLFETNLCDERYLPLKIKLDFEDKSMEDVWLALTWGK